VRAATALQSPQSTEFSEGHHPSTEARLAALVGGAALITIAARDRSWRSVGLALAGAPLVWRGATGSWPVQRTATEHTAEAAVPAPITASVTIGRPRQELWDFWRRLENLPQFMRHLDSVEKIDERRSHWIGKSPVGRVEWDAEIVDEREGHYLAWRSLPGSRVHNAGSVSFSDNRSGRGTVVRVEMEASPGNGLSRNLGRSLGRVLSGLTERQVHEDLRRFKNLMEAGEIPTTEGQSAGRRSAINIHNPF
jgi:uncharacterized membrane protein